MGSIVNTYATHESATGYWSEEWTYHAGFHRAHGFVLSVVRNIVRRTMEHLMDAVSAIIAHDSATGCASDRFSVKQ